MPFEEKIQHESFGMIRITRVSGGDRNLFGSSIPHGNTIRLSIHPATLSRDLNRDWYFADTKGFVEVEMSYTQFAEAIVNMNSSGVPVTVRYVNGKAMEPCPFTNKREQFQQEFAREMREVAHRLEVLQELAETLSKTKAPNRDQKDAILNEVKRIKQEIGSNMPFVAKSFNEQMDKTVLEAKGEFEAMVQHTITSLGLKALKEEDFRLLAAEHTPSSTTSQKEE